MRTCRYGLVTLRTPIPEQSGASRPGLAVFVSDTLLVIVVISLSPNRSPNGSPDPAGLAREARVDGKPGGFSYATLSSVSCG